MKLSVYTNFALLFLMALPAGPTSAQAKKVQVPKEALDVVAGFTLAPKMKAALFAAEPMVANPVAFSIDEKGRLFVCETYRQQRGVEDNRDHEAWISDDLASQTVDDRLALYKKHLRQGIKDYGKHQDRIRLLADRDGKGLADISSIYADGFDDPLEGTGAGILAHNGFVYYACIPRLWAFSDTDDDGKADRRGILSEGYGVRVAFRGHDLHGLNIGNDGRLYFTIGDRGMNVETDDGRVSCTETGAVLRCELSGAKLEIYATGLRNAQDLAFDDYGNLFTCDNNSDGGDKARWLHILDGGDYGWRMAYQYLGKNSIWHRERMWEPLHADQPAFLLPPVANIADGPAGIAHYPGTGLPVSYRGNFFLCDFRGAAEFSGVRTFKLKPQGASFRLIDPEVFVWKCLATDVQFGTNGRMYISDWVEGWVGTGKGRIHQVWHPKASQEKSVTEVTTLMPADFSELKVARLARLLAHPDRRLRQRAQFELVRRRDVKTLAQVAHTSKIQLAKLHGVWGLGQVGRSRIKLARNALEELAALLRDTDEDVRANAAKMLGETRFQPAAGRLMAGLDEPSLPVRRECALALARIGDREAVDGLVQLLVENNNEDPALRHAGVMGLAGCASELDLVQLASHGSPAVRLGAVLALRRRGSEKLAAFLSDEDRFVVEAAARAIYDEPIYEAYPELAKLTLQGSTSDGVLTRAVNACLRLGTEAHARAAVLLAADASKPSFSRIEAMEVLDSWSDPPSRDRIVGMWRPIQSDQRDADAVRDALEPDLAQLLAGNHEVRSRAARLAGKLNMQEAAERLEELVWDTSLEGKERAGALLALAEITPDEVQATVQKALADEAERVRAAARIVLTNTSPDAAVSELKKAIAKGSQLEKQSALYMLSNIGNKETDDLLSSVMRALVAGKVYAAVKLDIVEAARKRAAENPQIQQRLDAYYATWDGQDPLAPYRDALAGGNAERGEMLFRHRTSLRCVQCHTVNDDGGKVGPDISKVAATMQREQLLESILLPNKTIAKGYETIVLELDTGQTVSGIVEKKTKEQLTLRDSSDQLVTVDIEAIEASRKGISSMPENLIDQLSLFDLRDLLEYLAQLK